MRNQMSAAVALLLADLGVGAAHGHHPQNLLTVEQWEADAHSDVLTRAGEAGTIADGVPNVRPGETDMQSRLAMRPASPYSGDPALKMMGAPGLTRPVLISPPAAP